MAKARAKANTESTPQLADAQTAASEPPPLLTLYDQGTLILKTMNEQGCDRHSAIRSLREAGDIELSDNMGDKAETFARKFTRKQAELMANPPGKPPLTRAHIEVLIYVEDDKTRLEYMRRAIDERLSSRRLRQLCGPRNANRSTSGRKFLNLNSSSEVRVGLQDALEKPLRYIEQVLKKAKDGELAVSDDNRTFLKELHMMMKAAPNRFQQSSKKEKSPE